MKIVIDSNKFDLTKFAKEEELENAVKNLSTEIFGNKSLYIDIKKKIKSDKGSIIGIPDSYVLDFRERSKLWIVENELSTHDSFKHIGIQLLRFATQFSDASFKIKEVLLKAINDNQELKSSAQTLVKGSEFSNLGEALDFAIFKNDYGFVIVIDEISEDLSRITREFARQPELVQIQKFVSKQNEAYLFIPLLEELERAKSTKVKEIAEIDTIVCPAREEGFKEAFIEQKAWWAVRIAVSIIERLKYIAMYEVAPISAIRWAGKIQSIQPFEDTGKYKIYLSEIFEVGPIKLGISKLAPQAPRYTTFELLKKAKTLADIF
jgi:hypothetical protein